MFRVFEGVAANPSKNERPAASKDAVDKSTGRVPDRRGAGECSCLNNCAIWSSMFRVFEGVAAIPSNNERTAASNDAVGQSTGRVPDRRGAGVCSCVNNHSIWS